MNQDLPNRLLPNNRLPNSFLPKRRCRIVVAEQSFAEKRRSLFHQCFLKDVILAKYEEKTLKKKKKSKIFEKNN